MLRECFEVKMEAHGSVTYRFPFGRAASWDPIRPFWRFVVVEGGVKLGVSKRVASKVVREAGATAVVVAVAGCWMKLEGLRRTNTLPLANKRR